MKDVFCLSPSFPSLWKRKENHYMPKCRSLCHSRNRSTPMCHQLTGPVKSCTAQCGGHEQAPGPMGCSCCWQHQRDLHRGHGVGVLLRQEPARQQSCCSARLGCSFKATSKRMRWCGGTERVEDKVIPLQMQFGVLICAAVVLGIKLSPLKWGSPGQRPTRVWERWAGEVSWLPVLTTHPSGSFGCTVRVG